MTNDFMIPFIIILVIALPFAIPLLIVKFCKSETTNDSCSKKIPPVPAVPPTPPMPTYEEFLKHHGDISSCSKESSPMGTTSSNDIINNNVPAMDASVNTADSCTDNIIEKAAPEFNNFNTPAPAPVHKKLDMTVSTILFLIGTAFVGLSGIAFGVASWVKTSHEGKVGIICIAAAIAFALSWAFNKKLNLSGTSISFYILGAGFTATAFLTTGYYHLMGSWLSFSGGGCALLLALTLAIISVVLFIGNKLYDKLPLIYTGLSSSVLSLMFVVLQIFDILKTAAPAFIVLQALITAGVFMTEKRVHSNYKLPVERVGIGASIFYGLIAISYVMSSLFDPTVSSYICICVIIAQLLAYGINIPNKLLISVESVLSIVLASMISFTVIETSPDKFFIIVLGSLSAVIYFLHRFIPALRNAFTEAMTFSAAVLFGFISVMTATPSLFVPNLIIGAVVSVIIASYVFNSNNIIHFVSGISSPILPCVIAAQACNCISKAYSMESTVYLETIIWSILAFIFILVTAALIFRPESNFNNGKTQDGILHSNMIFSGIILISFTTNNILTLIPLFLCMFHFALSNRFRNNYTSILSSVSFIRLIYNLAHICLEGVVSRLSFDMMMFMVVLIFTIISKFCYKESIVSKNNGRTKIDSLFVTAWLAILPIFGTTRTDAFFSLMALAVFMTGFIKRDTTYERASVILTISTVMTSLAFITRPFFIPDYPEVSSKITIGIIALTGFICQKIWRRYDQTARNCANVIYILSFISLLFDAIYFDTAANTIFVMAVMTIALIISIMSRTKSWFITSATSLFIITVFATSDYLTALNWWVYLFITGVILISLAAFNEYCKKNNETLKSTVAKKFSDWNW